MWPPAFSLITWPMGSFCRIQCFKWIIDTQLILSTLCTAKLPCTLTTDNCPPGMGTLVLHHHGANGSYGAWILMIGAVLLSNHEISPPKLAHVLHASTKFGCVIHMVWKTKSPVGGRVLVECAVNIRWNITKTLTFDITIDVSTPTTWQWHFPDNIGSPLEPTNLPTPDVWSILLYLSNEAVAKWYIIEYLGQNVILLLSMPKVLPWLWK